MTGRISIPALREWATAEHATLGVSEKQREVLALVEAVEAAHATAVRTERCPICGRSGRAERTLTNTRWREVAQHYRDCALARFDFGEET